MAKKSKTTKTIASDNVTIFAGAGTGKSTTLEWVENGTPKGITPSEQQELIFDRLQDGKKRSVRVACFNNAIREELEPRFDESVDVRNTHKLGYHAFSKRMNIKWKRGYIDGRKSSKLAKEIIGNPYDDPQLWPVTTVATKLTDLAKLTMTGNLLVRNQSKGPKGPDDVIWEVTQSELIDMANLYTIDIEDGEALKYVEPMINESIRKCKEIIDFNDQVFLPNVFNCKPDKVDRVYIDEAQDLNAAQQGLLYGTAEQFVVVGDIYQSIYGFAGADPESMTRMHERLEAQALDLTVTRRCPKSHVERAKAYLPPEFDYRATEDAPEGLIKDTSFGVEFYASLKGTNNLILSRTNAPMVGACFTCWKNNIPASIRGRSIGTQLSNVIKKMRADDNESLILKLHAEYDDKIGKLKAADKLELASNKQDELDILLIFAHECDTPEAAITAIQDMFEDKENLKNAINFSTVHRAKGLETSNLGILTPELLPHPGISRISEFNNRQELNCAYVAYTRGKENMFINIAE